MVRFGTPLAANATRVLLLGSGELGKEVVIELQRMGIETIAVDRYDNAPAMQVAHRSHSIDMRDSECLCKLIEQEKPDFVVPEIEAIATSALVELERQGVHVVPSANAVDVTMNRERIRTLAAIELNLPTSRYRFVEDQESYINAVEEIGFPCVVKPIMSSSGKGQSTVRDFDHALESWRFAHDDARGSADRVIVEEMIDFDYEITLLTVQHISGVDFCEPIGHRQEKGDYQESWQSQPMDATVLKICQDMAARVTEKLGGLGLFGVEFFIKGKNVYFSELSPRPHDTGMVTLVSQELSEFALHARAFLGLPVPSIVNFGPSASAVVMVHGQSSNVLFDAVDYALALSDTQLRFFGKPTVDGERRMGVALARGHTVDEARQKASEVARRVRVSL